MTDDVIRCGRVQGPTGNVECPEPVVAVAIYQSTLGEVRVPLCELHYLEAQPPRWAPVA